MATFDDPHLVYRKPVILQVAALLVQCVTGLMDCAGETLNSHQHISEFKEHINMRSKPTEQLTCLNTLRTMQHNKAGHRA